LFKNLISYFKSGFRREFVGFIKSGNFKLLIILLGLVIVFYTPLLTLYKNFVVYKILVHIRENSCTKIVFTALYLGVVVWTIVRIRNKHRLGLMYFMYTAIITTIYIIHINDPTFEYCFFFFKFPFYILRYSDITILWFLLVTGQFIYGISIRFNEPKYDSTPFDVDAPIEISTEDLFGRKRFAELIATKIKSKYDRKSSIAIGIDGPWGAGKTSFIHMLMEAIESNGGKQNRIIMEFHPWKSSSPQQIITDFFDLFTSEMQKISPNLSRNVANYAKTLTAVEENLVSRSLGVLLDMFSEDISKEKQYVHINDVLESQAKQIVVFIDDLDRLDKKEIIEVIRLIRNTASFHNTIFVVTYEKEYVQNAIKELNEYNFKQYLDKIFQFEYTLSPIDKTILKNNLFERLTRGDGILKESHKDGFRSLLSTSEEITPNSPKPSLFDKYITTNRDVVRYVNCFAIEYAFSKDHVRIEDYAILQLLKLKYPGAHDALYEKRTEFLKVVTNTFYRHPTYNYALISESGNTPFLDYLKRDCSGIKYSDCEIDDIMELVNSLFEPTSEKDKGHEADKKSIRITDNFKNYFSASYFESNISTDEFESAFFSLPLEDFKKKIDEWVNKKYINNLMIRFSRINLFELNTKENYQKLIQSILHFTYRTSVPGSRYLFDMDRFQNIIYAGTDWKGGNYTKEEHLNFVRKVFKEAKSPYLYESWFIRSYKRRYAEELQTLSLNEFYGIQLDYLKDYLDDGKHKDFDKNIWTLLSDSKIITRPSVLSRESEIKEEANPAVLQFFSRFVIKHNLLDSFLKRIIMVDPRFGENYYLDMETINAIFKNTEDFEKYLHSQDRLSPRSEYLKEFYDFYSQYKFSGFGPAIPFKFIIIPVQKKLT
jgi:Cdc6-like AAA superfamily ATPase